MNNLVYGVGVNDLIACGPSSYTENGIRSMYPDYALWKAVLCRSVSQHEKQRRPSCLESSCHPDWYIRKNFQDWYFDQDNYYDSEGKILQIDKDILFINNQQYGPETSVLVPHFVNIVVRKMSKGIMPWVGYQQKSKRMLNEHKKPWRFEVFHEGKAIRQGLFDNPLSAHLAACEVKIQCLYQTIERYEKDVSFQQNVCDGLTNRIELLQKCIDKKRVCSFY